MSVGSARVAVFIDWQNTYKTAREAFGWLDYPNEYGNYSPYSLARLLATGNGRGERGELVSVNVYRGLPSQKFDQAGYAANRRQAAAWMKENPALVIPRLRPLRYARDGTAREKGVDVQLAIDALEWVVSEQCQIAIVFSHDSDLVPVVDSLVRLKGRDCVETVSWTSQTFLQRIRTSARVFHHNVSREVFDRIETRINYAHAAPP
jgi:uncharacterized LabA/DUF88 family protein